VIWIKINQQYYIRFAEPTVAKNQQKRGDSISIIEGVAGSVGISGTDLGIGWIDVIHMSYPWWFASRAASCTI